MRTMREIVLDTETTGLKPEEGHRIVEIGAVELLNHVPTGRVWHEYIDPQRDMPEEAYAIHGISEKMLAGKPVFRKLALPFLEFIGDAQLVIHNAAFDMKFINAELAGCALPGIPEARAVDTLAIARRKFPGAASSLDALCKRFGIDNSAREKHGALLDAELLAEVYLDLIGGRQRGLSLEAGLSERGGEGASAPARQRPVPLPPLLTAAEEAAHEAFVEELGPSAVWRV